MSNSHAIDSGKQRAAILHEALPYIQKFSGKTVVIKYGGHAMVDPQLKQSFAKDIVLLKQVGINPVIVHGGGPQIGDLLKRLNIESQFVDGHRVTDQATMDVVEMVLVGNVNKEIVNLIQQAGGRCVGLSGKDGSLIIARRKKISKEIGEGDRTPEIIDLGKVGEVENVNPQVIEAIEKAGFVAVIAPVGRSLDGETLNINADAVAAAIAEAVDAEKLILLSDVDGVKSSKGWVQTMSVNDVEELIQSKEAIGGMIPKLECAQHAIAHGVSTVHILDGRIPNVVLLELFTDAGIGTMIEREQNLRLRADAV